MVFEWGSPLLFFVAGLVSLMIGSGFLGRALTLTFSRRAEG